MHQVSRDPGAIIDQETPIPVYEAADYAPLAEAHNRSPGSWDSALLASPSRAKVFSLIPFYIESWFNDKAYVLKMDLYP